MSNTSNIIKRRLWGRRLTRPLGKMRQEAMDTLFPALNIPEDKLEQENSLDPATLFPQKFESYKLEIGFGNGEHLINLVRQNPDTAFLGAEPFINGMSALMLEIKKEEKNPPSNLRLLMDDAMILCRALKNECLNSIYILNPDPWPKKRHNKRRIVNPQNLDIFAGILKPGGKLIMTTDVDDLAEWMVTQASNHPTFRWTASGKHDWQTPPSDWMETRYAKKGKEAGRKQTFLVFDRI